MKAKLLHTEEVAKVLGVSRRTANGLMRTMPCVNIGTSTTRPHLAVLEPDLDAWIQSRRTVRQPDSEKREAVRRRKATTKLLVMDGLLDENGRIARRR